MGRAERFWVEDDEGGFAVEKYGLGNCAVLRSLAELSPVSQDGHLRRPERGLFRELFLPGWARRWAGIYQLGGLHAGVPQSHSAGVVWPGFPDAVPGRIS